jgi:hypothetical protein
LQAQTTVNEQIHFFRQGEIFSIPLPDSICLLHPEYENTDQLKQVKPIHYRVSAPFPSVVLEDSLVLGCYLVTPAHLFAVDSVLSVYHILEKYPEVQQIIITRSHNYLGYLEEMLNVPFVLPPRRLKDGKHQTDERLAVDCAELAIYGRRRQGYVVPYCGPKKIAEYLVPAQRFQPGTIIHFGHQVSVLYEDRGQPGVLDGEDLLIHAYKDKAEIIALKNTDLDRRPYRLYDWK